MRRVSIILNKCINLDNAFSNDQELVFYQTIVFNNLKFVLSTKNSIDNLIMLLSNEIVSVKSIFYYKDEKVF